MTQPDEIMTRIGEGTALGQQGRREAARELFAQLWAQIGPEGDPLHRCALAHSMADVQSDATEELTWDLRALEAADAVTDARAAESGMAGTVAGLYPSLHLNLGDVYLRLGDRAAARRHLEAGIAASGALEQEGYGAMIRRGLGGLQDRLDGKC